MLRSILSKIRGDCPIKKLIKMGLIMGKNCSVARNAVIDYSHCWMIEIGNDVTITSGCVILAHDASMHRDLNYTKIAKTLIKDGVFIGVNSVVLPGSVIGENTIVGAGSVVCGKLESNSVYVGNPAKKICSKEEFLQKHKEKILQSPNFNEKYTLRKKISAEKKKEMIELIGEKNGYIE